MRWFIALMVAVLCFAASSAWAASAYDDVPTDHWAYNALDYLTERGVLEGYPDGFFKGDRTLTRYEFAQAIARLLDTIGEVGNADEQIKIMAETLRAEFSDQLAQLAKEMDAMNGQISDLDARVVEMESGIADNASKIKALEDKVSGLKPGPNWQGQLLYRWHFETYPATHDTDYSRFNQRIAFMLGYSKMINDAVEVGFRLKTGTGNDARGSTFILGNNWRTAGIWLDRAYVKYTPSWFGYYTDANCNDCTPKLDIYAGIFGKDPLIKDPNLILYDTDVNMQGVGLVYHFNDDFQVSTVASVVLERNVADEGYFEDDVYMFATELRHDNLLIPCLDAWVGCYGWKNENRLPYGGANYVTDPAGNSVFTGYDSNVWARNTMYNFDFNNDGAVDGRDRFTPNFNTVKGGLQYTFQCLFPKPLAVYGEYAINIDSDAEDRINAVNPYVDPDIIYETSDDVAWGIGAQYGVAPKNVGDWYAYARYREVGVNAVVDGFMDYDRGANRNIFEVYWGWMWADNCTLGLTYILTKMHNAFGFAIPTALDDRNLVFVDWTFKF